MAQEVQPLALNHASGKEIQRYEQTLSADLLDYIRPPQGLENLPLKIFFSQHSYHEFIQLANIC